jgi:hypothetical protein
VLLTAIGLNIFVARANVAHQRTQFFGDVAMIVRPMLNAVLAAFGVATFMGVTSVHAQGAYTGSWRVSSWKVAPWVPAAERAGIKANTRVLNHTITFGKTKIAGPKIIACTGPKYEIKSVPFENLFEGGLKIPATEAPALGFKAPVQTLMPGCDMEFHSLDTNNAMFALDNVLYTMVRGTTKKS